MMMNVVNSAMSVSTQRYLTFELGKRLCPIYQDIQYVHEYIFYSCVF